MKTTVAIIALLFLSADSIDGFCAESTGQKIVRAARSQIGKTVRYDPSYRSLDYPSGDAPEEAGVCTDVVIRALRTALTLDLQKQVHEDMKAHFSSYPPNWGLRRPDKNIDHRRVPNLQTFLTRRGYRLARGDTREEYQPGDLVTCLVGGKLPHIMIVSDRETSAGTPLVIHNIGSGTREEDRLLTFSQTGHYRIKPGLTVASRPTSATNRPIRSYIVGSRKDGGTLSGIAKMFYGDASKWRSIHRANRKVISDPDRIRKGMTLQIP
jgi:uncharacterized protein